jgi:hypothetical protein
MRWIKLEPYGQEKPLPSNFVLKLSRRWEILWYRSSVVWHLPSYSIWFGQGHFNVKLHFLKHALILDWDGMR